MGRENLGNYDGADLLEEGSPADEARNARREDQALEVELDENDQPMEAVSRAHLLRLLAKPNGWGIARPIVVARPRAGDGYDPLQAAIAAEEREAEAEADEDVSFEGSEGILADFDEDAELRRQGQTYAQVMSSPVSFQRDYRQETVRLLEAVARGQMKRPYERGRIESHVSEAGHKLRLSRIKRSRSDKRTLEHAEMVRKAASKYMRTGRRLRKAEQAHDKARAKLHQLCPAKERFAPPADVLKPVGTEGIAAVREQILSS